MCRFSLSLCYYFWRGISLTQHCCCFNFSWWWPAKFSNLISSYSSKRAEALRVPILSLVLGMDSLLATILQSHSISLALPSWQDPARRTVLDVGQRFVWVLRLDGARLARAHLAPLPPGHQLRSPRSAACAVVFLFLLLFHHLLFLLLGAALGSHLQVLAAGGLQGPPL